MNRLLILAEDADVYAPLVEAANLPELQIVSTAGQAEASVLIADCNLVLGDPNLVSQVLSSAQRLEWVQSSWAGVDSLCKPDLRHDYLLTGVKDIFGALITEYVMTYVFALERQIFDMRQDQQRKTWQPGSYRLAKDITLGIAGLGSIGLHLAGIANAYGLRVTGLNRSGKACAGVEKVYSNDQLLEFLAELDYLVLTLPDTAQTRDFINADTLAMMKPSATLINVGRGNIINENDLIFSLQQKQISSAVLDVFKTEPLPTESPFWEMPNVYITPHIAATSFPHDVVEIFVENYTRFINRDALLHRIDFERGY